MPTFPLLALMHSFFYKKIGEFSRIATPSKLKNIAQSFGA
jgi:hypothetical protein